jgi:hypothetical protein
MIYLNGYRLNAIDDNIFSRLNEFTAEKIEFNIKKMKMRIDAHEGPIFVPLGENCGPGVKLRQAGLMSLGSGYFDNIVVPLE